MKKPLSAICALFILVAIGGCQSSKMSKVKSDWLNEFEQEQMQKPLTERILTDTGMLSEETIESLKDADAAIIVYSAEVSYDHYSKRFPSMMKLQPLGKIQ